MAAGAAGHAPLQLYAAAAAAAAVAAVAAPAPAAAQARGAQGLCPAHSSLCGLAIAGSTRKWRKSCRLHMDNLIFIRIAITLCDTINVSAV